MIPRLGSRSGVRTAAALAVTALGAGVLASCGSSEATTTPTLTFFAGAEPTNAEVAAQCSAESNGRYNINIFPLPNGADNQREQIVRRLAASSADIDFVALDTPYVAELANASWLREFTEEERTVVLKDILEAPILSAVWKDKLVAVPWVANTQLLWYKKSVAKAAGVDPSAADFTWDKMIDAAVKVKKTVQEQGRRYEGYMVWINGLIESAGGSILTNNDLGRDATVSMDSPEGREAARIILKLADSPAADPALSTANEEATRLNFQTPSGGFMLNWPYVYAGMQAAIKAGTLTQAFLDDVGWARYPRVVTNLDSKPPLGGSNLAISKFSKNPDLSVEAIKCLISPAKEKFRMLGLGEPMANGTIYDDPEIRAKNPMADLIKESINDAGPRPITPFYGDVSSATTREWHPESQLEPEVTPAVTAELITDVLHDRRLL